MILFHSFLFSLTSEAFTLSSVKRFFLRTYPIFITALRTVSFVTCRSRFSIISSIVISGRSCIALSIADRYPPRARAFSHSYLYAVQQTLLLFSVVSNDIPYSHQPSNILPLLWHYESFHMLLPLISLLCYAAFYHLCLYYSFLSSTGEGGLE